MLSLSLSFYLSLTRTYTQSAIPSRPLLRPRVCAYVRMCVFVCVLMTIRTGVPRMHILLSIALLATYVHSI